MTCCVLVLRSLNKITLTLRPPDNATISPKSRSNVKRILFSEYAFSKIKPFGRRRRFSSQGVAMLSSFLNSERAVKVNIEIMRAFVRLQEMIASHKDLAKRLDELEKKYDLQFKVVF